jgi:hypothetical protein
MTKSHIIQDPAITLGQGYSTDMQMAAPFGCFNPGNVTTTGGGAAVINFDNAVSFDEVQKSLNVDVSVSGGIGPFSASASAVYAQYIQDDHYSQSFYYFEKIFLPTQIWNPNGFGTSILNAIGQGAYQEGPEEFRLVCGDQVVTQVEEGISLYVSMKLIFSSYYDKQTFQANAGSSFGNIIDVSASVQRMVSEYNLNGEVEVTAFQEGGNPSQLPLIFSQGANGYYVTSCSLQDLNACQGTINGVLAYAQGNLPNQTTTGNGAPLSSVMQPLTFLGLNTGNSTVTPDVQAAREWLGQAYLNQSSQATFVGHLLGSPFMSAQYVGADILNELSNQNTNLQSNLAVFEDPNTGVIACYTSPTTCIDTEQNIQQSLNAVNNTFIDQFNNGYSMVQDIVYINDAISTDTIIYPGGNNQFLVSYNTYSPVPPNEAIQIIAQTEEELSISIYLNQVLYNCAPVIAMPDFPDQYNVSYYPGSPDYETWNIISGSQHCLNTCYGSLTYTIIDNPI